MKKEIIIQNRLYFCKKKKKSICLNWRRCEVKPFTFFSLVLSKVCPSHEFFLKDDLYMHM